MPRTRNDCLDVIPLELWGKILLHLEAGVGEGLCLRYLDPRLLYEQQFQYHRLRAVCRRFRDVFYAEPALSRGLILSPDMPTSGLYSLIIWMKAYGKFVQTLAVHGRSRGLYEALRAVNEDETDLRSVYLTGNDMYVSWLSKFTTLTTCEIINPIVTENHPAFDVSSLSSLPKLGKLFLTNGDFTCTQLPLQLNTLALEGSDLTVQETCACVSSLQKFCVINTTWYIPCPETLGACPDLEELQLERSDIGVIDGQKWCDLDKNHRTVLPDLVGLSQLKHFTMIHASHSPEETPEFDVSCLCSLTSLEFLQMFVETTSVHVPASLTALKSLSYLLIAANGDNAGMELTLEVDWQHMKTLHHLEISDVQLYCNADILGLSSLHNLKHLSLKDSVAGSPGSSMHVGKLINCLAKDRPDIQVIFEDEAWDIEGDIVEGW